MLKTPAGKTLLALVLLASLALAAFQLPTVNRQLVWRADIALTYLRGILYPADHMPKPLAQAPDKHLPPPAVAITRHPTPTPDGAPAPIPIQDTPTPAPPTATPTPLPPRVQLASPAYEKQEPNNCGPATLAMYLRLYGWKGDQVDISDRLKPKSADRNVNVEELTYYARTNAGWLSTEYRVGGDLLLLKRFLAAGFPVMIEEGVLLEETYWPNDDHWAGHYLLLNGYDDVAGTFLAQDSFRGPDQQVPYEKVRANWQAFNYVFILIYPNDQSPSIQQLLGEDWDVDANRQKALGLARSETADNPENAYAWFNLGSNLVYFEKYGEAARAYDTARNLGLPQRMLRYQFGPFFAYFFSGRNDELLALTEYALQRTPNSEEALLWRGWGQYRAGKKGQAIELFNQALVENPFYQDAKYALDFVRNNP
jgi:tetratricopeptide (TPR) repeat protein